MGYCFFVFLFFLSVPVMAQDALPSDTVHEVALSPIVEPFQGGKTAEDKATEEVPEPLLSPEYELYDQGRHYLTQQRIDLAQKAFDDVIAKYSQTPEAILARFWIGEFMLRAKNYSGSSIAFGQAYGALKKAQRQKDFSQEKFHGEQGRLPEILAKLAYSLKMINKKGDACITLRQIKRDYKKRPATLDWYTAKLSKELKCP